MKETVKIVRCKNCQYWDRDWKSRYNTENVTPHYCPLIDKETDDDFFCSYGAVRFDLTPRTELGIIIGERDMGKKYYTCRATLEDFKK